MSDDQVLVKMLRVGLCGTDAEINLGRYGQPPIGEELLTLGHENLGLGPSCTDCDSAWR